MDFALKKGETTVVVLPDHGNSEFSIGRYGLPSYDRATIEDLFGNVSKHTKTTGAIEKMLQKAKNKDLKVIFKKYTDIDLTDDELQEILKSKNYQESDYLEKSNSVNLWSTITSIKNSRNYFGFTSGGHTGEEVFLATYHSSGDIPLGMHTNVEVNQSLYAAMGLRKPLNTLTEKIFASFLLIHLRVFQYLTVKNGETEIIIPVFKSVVYVNGIQVDLKSIPVYIDKNNTFYCLKYWL